MVHDEVLAQIDSDELAVFAVWMPVLQSDNAAAGRKAEPLIPDPRVVHYWDGDNSLGKLYGRSLALPRGRQLAWDVYFAYAPGIMWDDELPPPTQWMHQLGLGERRLTGEKLRGTIVELLDLEAAETDEELDD